MKTLKTILRATLAILVYLIVTSALALGGSLLLAHGVKLGLEFLGLWSFTALLWMTIPLMLFAAFWTLWVSKKYYEIVSRPAMSLLAIPEYR